jgi:hypothetical protein
MVVVIVVVVVVATFLSSVSKKGRDWSLYGTSTTNL